MPGTDLITQLPPSSLSSRRSLPGFSLIQYITSNPLGMGLQDQTSQRFQSTSVASTLTIQLIIEFFKLVVRYLKDQLEMKGKSKQQVQREAMTAGGTAHCTKDYNKSKF